MTLDFIPIHSYTAIYYYLILACAFIVFLHAVQFQIGSNANTVLLRIGGPTLLLFVLFYMGLRPLSGVFVDMTTYAHIFEVVKSGVGESGINDPIFNIFISSIARVIDVNTFFLVCSILYVLPLYFVTKRWFGNYWFYAFLMLVGSLSFWSYGVNGIRNGIATSLFLMGISDRIRVRQLAWLLLAIGFHKSMLLPTLGLMLAQIFSSPRGYVLLWLCCIPLSLAFGGFWENFFVSTGFGDERIGYLTAEVDVTEFSKTGYRWDFLLFSASAVLAGWYYIFKRHYRDPIYFVLFNTYLFSNSFWILVNRANFSNRFAYLSWFLMGLVLVYPLIRSGPKGPKGTWFSRSTRQPSETGGRPRQRQPNSTRSPQMAKPGASHQEVDVAGKKFFSNRHAKIGLVIFANCLITFLLS